MPRERMLTVSSVLPRRPVRRFVHEPDHALGQDARGGQFVAGLDPLERVALARTRDGEHRQAGPGEGREGQRQTRVRMEIVAGRDDQPLALVERERTGEERRRMPVWPEAEVNEVEGPVVAE